MMKRYDSYKSSGVEWLGEIPAHWELKKLKYVAAVNPSKADILSGIDDEQPVTFLPMEKVSENGTVDTEIKKPIKELVSGFTFFQERDVIVAKITPCFENGKGAYLEKLDSPFGFGSTEFHVLRGHEEVVLNEFLYYVTKSNLFMELGEGAMTGAGGQKRVPTPFLQDYLLTYPSSLTEQKAIVDFVKSKTSQIDSLIQKKQQLIALLEEEKTAVINEAVTKGLNPNASMKNSGIEWLGMVPAHWDAVKLKYYTTKISDGIHATPNYVDISEIFFINGTNLNNGKITVTSGTRCVDGEEYEKHKVDLKEGTILLSLNGTIGKLAFYNDEKVILGKSAAYIECSDGLLNTYAYYYLQTSFVKNYFYESFSGSTINNLSLYTLRNTPLALPPTEEQKLIVDFLNTKLHELNSTIGTVSREIELMQEYRTALISEAVTGKIDVRDYQPEPITSTALA